MNNTNISFNSNTKHQIDKSLLLADKSINNIINTSDNSYNINQYNSKF